MRHLKYRNVDEHYVVPLNHSEIAEMDERCPIHNRKFLELFCNKCVTPVCAVCMREKHSGHNIGDFATIYSTALDFVKDKISTIKKELLPRCKASLREIRKKERVIQNQISKLTETADEYEDYLNGTPYELVSFYRNRKSEPEELLLPEIKSENSQIDDRPMFQKLYKATHLDQYVRVREAFNHGRSTSKTSSPSTMDTSEAVNNEISVPVVKSAHHISCTEDGHVWVSDNLGNLVLMDVKGKSLMKLVTNGGDEGYHSATIDGELIYADKTHKCVKKITTNKEVQTIFKTGMWRPTCVFSSPKNKDIFVGLVSDQHAKIGRFDKTGRSLFDIDSDSRGEPLLKYPLYLTENKNNDICVSDVNKHAVVVIDMYGRHRFSYKGGGNRGFWPHGISTDDEGHILICNSYYSNPSVEMIDKNGTFLFIILAQKHGLQKPRGLCVDNQQRLWVGQWHDNKVCVYKITV
ncbi:uncharacterized protein LOC133204788 [Saccostrea echinata]|uniref:uncharacterized protein LOC133204788 n=1 Tax=Saccostrea echinata TaxID=191078 RepID=UPI002A81F776|nr:uncharacterized protein LOC133204788 [Saccostrea echinata]